MTKSRKGFAGMSEEKQREIASKGGKASASKGNTSKRGFASMDPEKQRAISSLGGKAQGAKKKTAVKEEEE